MFKHRADGQLMASSKTGTPSKSQTVLLPLLESIAEQLGEEPPRSEKKRIITTSRDYWGQFDHLPFIANWIALEETSKLLSFFTRLDADRIHPRYSCMVRTGRTSSHNPNVQQLPRDGRVREGIVAPPGCSLYAVDFSYIELRTLAAVCEARFGHSKLGQIIREGADPHCYVAAMFDDVSYDEFMGWRQTDREKFSTLRQRSKALNFGIPGGFGAKDVGSVRQNHLRRRP